MLGGGGTYVGGSMGVSIAIGTCAIVFGIPTAGGGALACAIIGGAAGGFAVGKAGSAIGESAGKLLYETVRD